MPISRKNVVYDEMTRLKETSDWDALVRLAEPFQLRTVRIELAVDHYYDISIRHETHGYATRRISGNTLSAEAASPAFIVRDAIVSMKEELGFGSSLYGNLKRKKEEVPIVLAQSQPHKCGKHGNQLVSAQNPKTGETALRCPVDGCTTILRKRRKSGPSEEAKAAWKDGSPMASASPPLKEPVTETRYFDNISDLYAERPVF
jgi:hypothetical protein